MSESEEDKAVMAELKAELVKKAEAAGVEIDKRWNAEKIEAAISAHVLSDPTEPEDKPDAPDAPDERDARIAELEAKNAELEARVEALLNEIREISNAPAQKPDPETDPSAEDAGEVSDEPVTLRITKKGDGKVADGQDGTFEWNDEPELPYSIAKALEDKGFGEIIE